MGASIAAALCTQTSVLFCQDKLLPGVSLGSASSNPCGFSVCVCARSIAAGTSDFSASMR